MSRALLLRHGESAHNAHTGSQSLPDEEGDRLTERGRAQAQAAGLGLTGYGLTQLLVSPMRRAAETAGPIGAALGLEPETLPYVDELRAGESFADLVARVRQLKAALESAALDEPRSIVALPAFRHSPAASLVTLGRFS